MSQSVCEMVELGGKGEGGGQGGGGLVKTTRGRCGTHGGSGYGGDRGMGGSVKPSLADSRRTSTASDQESLSVQSWSMPGSGWSPDSTHVHSISDDDLVGKVEIVSI